MNLTSVARVSLRCLFVGCLFLAGCGPQADQKPQDIGNRSEGKKIGYWTHYHEDGSLKSRGMYDDDLREGEWEFYYPEEHAYYTGQVKATGDFSNGMKIGDWEEYYPDGELALEGAYNTDGERIGRWVAYHENGEIKWSGYYEEGVKKGYWESRFPDGETQAWATYDKGLPKDGPFRLDPLRRPLNKPTDSGE
ncbi:Hypothetical protein PBC10988_11370 [Planctomycetales bacterium 10988]|nr:Hypothetical protein PBC10988_11370 [Planctomycetales bacterium 10988]